MERVELDFIDLALGVFGAIDRTFDSIAQFAHVTGPWIGFECVLDPFRKARPVRPFELGRHPPPEVLGEQRDIALASAQRRQRDDLETQPVEQIGAEPAFLDQPRQMLVGGGDDPHIDLNRPRRADAGDLAIFDRPQQAVLRRR